MYPTQAHQRTQLGAFPFAKVSTSIRSAPSCPSESSLVLSANQEALRTAADVSPSPWLKISKDLHMRVESKHAKNSATNLNKHLLLLDFLGNLWSRK